jgi:hypothetical protein
MFSEASRIRMGWETSLCISRAVVSGRIARVISRHPKDDDQGAGAKTRRQAAKRTTPQMLRRTAPREALLWCLADAGNPQRSVEERDQPNNQILILRLAECTDPGFTDERLFLLDTPNEDWSLDSGGYRSCKGQAERWRNIMGYSLHYGY